MNKQLANRIYKAAGPLSPSLYLFYLLLNDFNSWPFFPAWFQSFRRGYSLLNNGVPLLPFKVSNWLQAYLRREMKIFEYGSGGSTIFFARRAGKVFSVEHDKNWYTLVSARLLHCGLTNCSYKLYEPLSAAAELSTGKGFEHPPVFDERDWEYPGMSFDAYVRAIDSHPDQSFDLILVDGRARAACITRSLNKVRKGGYLMLDNSNDSRIVQYLETMKPLLRTDFRGVAPGWPPARWQTSVWRLI